MQKKYNNGKPETKEIGYLRGQMERDGKRGQWDSRGEEGVTSASIPFCIALTLRTIVMFNRLKI